MSTLPGTPRLLAVGDGRDRLAELTCLVVGDGGPVGIGVIRTLLTSGAHVLVPVAQRERRASLHVTVGAELAPGLSTLAVDPYERHGATRLQREALGLYGRIDCAIVFPCTGRDASGGRAPTAAHLDRRLLGHFDMLRMLLATVGQAHARGSRPAHPALASSTLVLVDDIGDLHGAGSGCSTGVRELVASSHQLLARLRAASGSMRGWPGADPMAAHLRGAWGMGVPDGRAVPRLGPALRLVWIGLGPWGDAGHDDAVTLLAEVCAGGGPAAGGCIRVADRAGMRAALRTAASAIANESDSPSR